ncbi:transporter [Solimonas terrae]|uniref:Transporter n=1 Tax=Solimonas terrae TaxID=1396819 RepID=A0A6M2BS04_9GAMM|nr:transporter [Solimonas terrae]NGY05386.1 transporter [Solimonas terrae]
MIHSHSNAPLRALVLSLIAAGTSSLPLRASACSSCGCNIGVEWADSGYSTAAGLRLDLRYDFINQDQLRYGAHAVRRRDVEIPNEEEIQQGTLTRFYTLGLDYSIDHDWGLSVQLPTLQREHQTIDEGDTGITGSSTSGIGDLRVIGRYQGFFADHSWGLQFGLQLPTGKIDDRFDRGAEAGETLDRGLQNGTGTTDLIVGVYHYAALSRDWDRFEQLQLKQALDTRDGFRPGTQISLNAGLRYVGFTGFIPQLQINSRIEGHETGAEADYQNSGSQVIALSPGVSAGIGGQVSLSGFLQLPVYQHYTGYQLAPHYIASVNLGYRF